METIDGISEAAEQRDVNALLSFVSASYTDEKERTYEDIKKLVDENLSRFQGIVAKILATEIITLQLPQATVKTDALFSSGAAKIFRKLLNFTGTYYQFNLDLIKEDNIWKIKSASWERIALEDLLPESTDIIKEL
jgi:hypothetical protein